MYPKTTENEPKDVKNYEFPYKTDYIADWDVHRNYIQDFDSYEAMLIGQVYDSVSRAVDGSKITDSYAMTLAKERADRVIAKLPDGVTEAVGKADVGKAAFMDILRQKWYYPNANAQHPFLEKLNMWQLYSSVYGYMPMFYDWNVSSTGYVGPDCWLWNPRNLIPQQGRTSLADMDYVTALTWVSKRYLKDQLKQNDAGWDHDALNLLIELADKLVDQDSEQDTKVSRDRTPQAQKKGICLATRYEAGKDGEWVVFAPDHGYIEVRRLANPHKNGRIPFVIKYSQPLFDSFYGLGDFQRAKPLQFARDGLTNFYFKGIKMNLIPPIVANANGVVKHTLDYREGGVMLETIPNSIRRLETSVAGLSTYKDAQSNLTGSLLSLYGSQNASLPGAETLNPSQGKTPAAIDLYSQKEATRDGAERRHLEAAIEQLIDGFNSLTVNIGTEDIPVTLFRDDIRDIMNAGLGDIRDLFKGLTPNENGTAGDLKINPKALKGIEYRFNVNPDSTLKANKTATLEALKDFMDRMGKMQNVFQEDPRLSINWDKITSSYEELTGIPNASEFISFDPSAQPTPPQPEQPSPTAVTLPSGVVLESADLIKLYLGSEDGTLKNQIIEALGFDATPDLPPAPTVSSSGHVFNDPDIAAAASALDKHMTAPLPPMVKPEPATMKPAKK
jgi:hypothetical protein